jgi:hypothetical protein
MKKMHVRVVLLMLLALTVSAIVLAAGSPPADMPVFPPSLDGYGDTGMDSIIGILGNRIRHEPFNLIASLIFLCAIIHTFLTGRFMVIAHRWTHDHEEKIKKGLAPRDSVHHGAEVFHFLGEVEAVFGIWAAALLAAIVLFFGWPTAKSYILYKVNFTEPMFVVVIMTLAATRPILQVTERFMWRIARLLGGTLTAWWWTILTVGPILGSFITEPAAMTIAAMLLADKFYALAPSGKFKYATLGLLFVNISVGGTLTSYAAPPVLMVAAPWEWDTLFMLTHFGWKAVLGILVANLCYFLIFRSELKALQKSFAMNSLKDEIQQRYLKRADVEDMMDQCIEKLDDRFHFVDTFSEQLKEAGQEITRRLGERALADLKNKGVDPDLAKRAFEERNKEIQLRRMRRAMPGLLPPEERPQFLDPDWDHRDDPVPLWVTLVHIAFMGWTIINAHYPTLFHSGPAIFSWICPGEFTLSEPAQPEAGPSGGIFPRRPGDSRGPSGLVDRTGPGQSERDSLDAGIHDSYRIQRQRGHHLPEYVGAQFFRWHEILGGRRGRCRRRVDHHCQCTQPRRAEHPQILFRRGSVAR